MFFFDSKSGNIIWIHSDPDLQTGFKHFLSINILSHPLAKMLEIHLAKKTEYLLGQIVFSELLQ